MSMFAQQSLHRVSESANMKNKTKTSQSLFRIIKFLSYKFLWRKHYYALVQFEVWRENTENITQKT